MTATGCRSPLPAGVLPHRRWLPHVLAIVAIAGCVCALYWGVTQSYFCSDDDFLEVHRAAFEDARSPARIFTTPHFGTFKYRPLNRLLTRLTFQAGGGSAWPFRVRNLACHVLNALGLYILAILLGKPVLVAGTAALLFGLHPLANQSVIGSVMTNTAAATAFLAALICLVVALKRPRPAGWWIGFGVTATLSVFLYDTYIVVFAVACVYVLLFEWWLRRRIPRHAVAGLLLSVVICLGLYAGLRARFVPSGYTAAAATIPSPKPIVMNVGAYAVAVLAPLDVVLANHLFGAPFPSEPRFWSGPWWLVMAAGAAVVAVAAGLMACLLLRRRPPVGSRATAGFLATAGVMPLLPVLLFTEHPSETYLYATVACWCLLGTSLVFGCASCFGRQGRTLFAAAAGALAMLYAGSTLVRNGRVAACAATANTILASVRVAESEGEVRMVFADAPGEPAPARYGFYSFQGLDTVANRPDIRSRTLTRALQLATGNPRVTAEVTTAGKLPETAHRARASAAFWVHRDGSLTPLSTRRDPGAHRAPSALSLP